MWQRLPENNWKAKIRIQAFHLTPLSSWSWTVAFLFGKKKNREKRVTLPVWPESLGQDTVIDSSSTVSLVLMTTLSSQASIPIQFQSPNRPSQNLNAGAVSGHHALSQLKQKVSLLSPDFGAIPEMDTQAIYSARSVHIAERGCCSAASPTLFPQGSVALKPHPCTFSNLSYLDVSYPSPPVTGSLD